MHKSEEHAVLLCRVRADAQSKSTNRSAVAHDKHMTHAMAAGASLGWTNSSPRHANLAVGGMTGQLTDMTHANLIKLQRQSRTRYHLITTQLFNFKYGGIIGVTKTGLCLWNWEENNGFGIPVLRYP